MEDDILKADQEQDSIAPTIPEPEASVQEDPVTQTPEPDTVEPPASQTTQIEQQQPTEDTPDFDAISLLADKEVPKFVSADEGLAEYQTGFGPHGDPVTTALYENTFYGYSPLELTKESGMGGLILGSRLGHDTIRVAADTATWARGAGWLLRKSRDMLAASIDDADTAEMVHNIFDGDTAVQRAMKQVATDVMFVGLNRVGGKLADSILQRMDEVRDSGAKGFIPEEYSEFTRMFEDHIRRTLEYAKSVSTDPTKSPLFALSEYIMADPDEVDDSEIGKWLEMLDEHNATISSMEEEMGSGFQVMSQSIGQVEAFGVSLLAMRFLGAGYGSSSAIKNTTTAGSKGTRMVASIKAAIEGTAKSSSTLNRQYARIMAMAENPTFSAFIGRALGALKPMMAMDVLSGSTEEGFYTKQHLFDMGLSYAFMATASVTGLVSKLKPFRGAPEGILSNIAVKLTDMGANVTLDWATGNLSNAIERADADADRYGDDDFMRSMRRAVNVGMVIGPSVVFGAMNTPIDVDERAIITQRDRLQRIEAEAYRTDKLSDLDAEVAMMEDMYKGGFYTEPETYDKLNTRMSEIARERAAINTMTTKEVLKYTKENMIRRLNGQEELTPKLVVDATEDARVSDALKHFPDAEKMANETKDALKKTIENVDYINQLKLKYIYGENPSAEMIEALGRRSIEDRLHNETGGKFTPTPLPPEWEAAHERRKEVHAADRETISTMQAVLDGTIPVKLNVPNYTPTLQKGQPRGKLAFNISQPANIDTLFASFETMSTFRTRSVMENVARMDTDAMKIDRVTFEETGIFRNMADSNMREHLKHVADDMDKLFGKESVVRAMAASIKESSKPADQRSKLAIAGDKYRSMLQSMRGDLETTGLRLDSLFGQDSRIVFNDAQVVKEAQVLDADLRALPLGKFDALMLNPDTYALVEGGHPYYGTGPLNMSERHVMDRWKTLANRERMAHEANLKINEVIAKHDPGMLQSGKRFVTSGVSKRLDTVSDFHGKNYDTFDKMTAAEVADRAGVDIKYVRMYRELIPILMEMQAEVANKKSAERVMKDTEFFAEDALITKDGGTFLKRLDRFVNKYSTALTVGDFLLETDAIVKALKTRHMDTNAFYYSEVARSAIGSGLGPISRGISKGLNKLGKRFAESVSGDKLTLKMWEWSDKPVVGKVATKLADPMAYANFGNTFIGAFRWMAGTLAHRALNGNLLWSATKQWSSYAVNAGISGIADASYALVEAASKTNRQRYMQTDIGTVKSGQRGGLSSDFGRHDGMIHKTRMENLASAATKVATMLENYLSAASYFGGKMTGERLGMTGDRLEYLAMRAMTTSQSVYNRGARALILNDAFLRALSPFQSFSVDMFNNVRAWGATPGAYTKTERFQSAANFLLAAGATNLFYNLILGKEDEYLAHEMVLKGPWSQYSFLPSGALMLQFIGVNQHSYGGDIGPVAFIKSHKRAIDQTKRTGSWEPVVSEFSATAAAMVGAPSPTIIKNIYGVMEAISDPNGAFYDATHNDVYATINKDDGMLTAFMDTMRALLFGADQNLGSFSDVKEYAQVDNENKTNKPLWSK